MKKTLLIFLLPILSFGQTQIGSTILGKYPMRIAGASFFGAHLSLSKDGKVLAIGDYQYASSAGTVWIYKNIDGNWTQFGNEFPIGYGADQMGKSISLSNDGNVIAVGLPEGAGNGRETGYAQVYKNISGIWTKLGADIKGRASGEYCGTSISLSGDGNSVAIGASGNSQNNFHGGCVRVYKIVDGVWTKIGNDLYGKTSGDEFGSRISLSDDGEILAVGTYYNSISVYKNINENWTLIGNEIPGYKSNLNCVLSKDGKTLVVLRKNGEFDLMTVIIFNLIDNVWKQTGSIKQKALNDGMGQSISISGNGSLISIGYPEKDGNGDESGVARLYGKVGENWEQLGIDIKGIARYDKNGSGVFLSADGTTLAVGAPYDDNIVGENAGAVKVYNLSAFLNNNNFVMSNFNVFPNPASQSVTINFQENLNLQKVNIYNIIGQLIKTENNKIINVNYLSKGTYFFEIITDKGKATKKILIN